MLFEALKQKRFWCLLVVCVFAPVVGFPLLAVIIGRVLLHRWRDSAAWANSKEHWRMPVVEEQKVAVRDGVVLNCYILRGGPKVMLFCQPLGGSGLRSFLPLIYEFISSGEWTFITWDYRGLFSSSTPNLLRRIAIPEHAQDAKEVLAAFDFQRADVIVGHSMGVQVSLEFAALFPSQLEKMVLLNGAHGQVFSSACQPLFRVPFIANASRTLISALLKTPSSLERMRKFLKPLVNMFVPVYTRMFGSKLLQRLIGPCYYSDFLNTYMGQICYSQQTTSNWLYLFMELDAHSLYHYLPQITTPTLAVAGLWDMLTPAYQMLELARAMPNAEAYIDPWSSHVSIYENPEYVMQAVQKFVTSPPDAPHGTLFRALESE